MGKEGEWGEKNVEKAGNWWQYNYGGASFASRSFSEGLGWVYHVFTQNFQPHRLLN